MLHPEKPEHATGADLLYEMCSPRDRKVRITLVQYKVWSGEVLYLSKSRVQQQLDRLRSTVCGAS
jgi:hypothetical protein